MTYKEFWDQFVPMEIKYRELVLHKDKQEMAGIIADLCEDYFGADHFVVTEWRKLPDPYSP